MNKKAVKQLTEKGCIVAQEAAESLTEEDIEYIESLDSPPMYITEKMLAQIRSNGTETSKPNGNKANGSATTQDPKTVAEPGPQEKEDETAEGSEDAKAGAGEDLLYGNEEEQNEEESKEEESADKVSEAPIKDTGRKSIRTKVEILDEKDISREEKDVPEFLQYYNDRYDRMKKMLLRRMELQSAVSIQRLERRDEGEQAATVGLVKNKYSTSTGKYIIELEDKTGTFKVLADERDGDRIVPDEVIGVRGSMGGDIIYANSIIRPDLPIPDGVNTTEQRIKAAYISDLHLGSKDTLHDRFDKFARWLNTDDASDIGYLVIPGDLVEGVGTYPGQEEELEVTDIYKQYELFENWVEKVPEDIQILVGPGNHDIVRLAEPQPRLPEEALSNIKDFNNVHRVQNPQMVRLHGIESQGIKNLMYHGFSFDDHVDQIQELREKAYDDPHHVMIDLLKRRHLAPTFGSNLLSPEEKDSLVIEEKPDIMVSGHFHSHACESYKGVNVICASTFQGQTDFQKRMGHEPQPGRVTVVDYKTRKTEVKKF